MTNDTRIEPSAIAPTAVVKTGVSSYPFAGGVPARPIHDRFPHEVAEHLRRIAWRDRSREQIEARFDHLHDLNEFLAMYDAPDMQT